MLDLDVGRIFNNFVYPLSKIVGFFLTLTSLFSSQPPLNPSWNVSPLLLSESENVSPSVVSNWLWPHGARQAPLSVEFSRQEHWSGLAFPSPGYLSNPDIKPRSPILQADALASHQGSLPNPSNNKTGMDRVDVSSDATHFLQQQRGEPQSGRATFPPSRGGNRSRTCPRPDS